MKKSLLALAALTAFAGAASAQSSVTLFGLVDLSANAVKNGSTSSKILASNQLNSNRLGFRGVEDLGGGLKAGFWLEAGMDNDTGGLGGSNGLGTVTFNRRSTVSLMGNFGELRLGRDYTPTFWNLAVFDVDGANGVGEGLNIVSTLGSGANTLVRDNNSIGYFLPSLGGLYGQFMVAAPEGNSGYRYTGGRIGYGAGPVNFAVAYGDTKTTVSDDFKDTNFGGSWAIGPVTIYGFYNQSKFGSAKQTAYELSLGWNIGAGQVRASLGKAKASGTSPLAKNFDGQEAKLASVEYVYDLSKRTSLYTSYGSISNSGGAAFTVIGGGQGSALNDKSTAYNVGLRHSF